MKFRILIIGLDREDCDDEFRLTICLKTAEAAFSLWQGVIPMVGMVPDSAAIDDGGRYWD